jgi:hypothetical protein
MHVPIRVPKLRHTSPTKARGLLCVLYFWHGQVSARTVSERLLRLTATANDV